MKSKGPRVPVTVRLPASLARRVREAAKQESKTINDFVMEQFEAHIMKEQESKIWSR